MSKLMVDGRQMIRINLLPVRAAKKKESLRFQMTVGGLVIFFVIAITLLVFVGFLNSASSLRSDIRDAEVEYKQLQKKIGELARLKDDKRLLEDKLRVVEELDKARTGPVRLFTSIGEAIPEMAWIDSLKENERVVTVNGFAAYDDIVADFMRRLEVKDLGNIELEVAKREPSKTPGMDLVGFTLRLEKR